jgi:uncharacterized phage-like protein YoqJ
VTAWPTVMVTGHRPKHFTPTQQSWVREELVRLAVKLRDERGMTTGISGMAIGSDLWWADSVVKAGVRLEAHIPFTGQADSWPKDQHREYVRLLGLAADTVTYESAFTMQSFHQRNYGMIHSSSQVVGIWRRGATGGTLSTLKYALSLGYRPVWVNPDERVVEWPTVDAWREIVVRRPLGRSSTGHSAQRGAKEGGRW